MGGGAQFLLLWKGCMAPSQLTPFRYLPGAVLSCFDVCEKARVRLKCSLGQYLWDGTSRLPGDPPDAVSKALGCLLHMFLCDGVHTSKMTAA